MEKTNNIIQGAKGGGGGGSSPTRTPDNLRSKDTVEVVLGLCEGPIKGLVDGAKSFNIGDTPLQNVNGEYNFNAFELNVFTGVSDATPIKARLGGQSSNHPVNVTLGTDTPVTRVTQILTGIDYIDVRIVFSRLMRSLDSGTFEHTANFRIEYKQSSASVWKKAYGQDLSITGKTTSNYVKEFRIAVDNVEGDTYDIRVTKLSPINSETDFADMAWESYQETVAADKAYDDTALIQIIGDSSDQFSNIPQWSEEIDGLLVKVPSNYNPETRVYSGIWDGTWKVAWTNNPAWCLYDLLTNDRYGVRAYYKDLNVDKYDMYEAAQWCDELVPDGQGGTQPRYTYNAEIKEPRSGTELVRYIAGSFNSTLFDDLNGTAYLRIDKEDDAVAVFTQEDIHNGEFSYSYTEITSRYNDITVTFINPELNWEEDRRRIFDQDLIDKYGRIPLDFIAVGCTNAHEGKRRAQHKLLTSNTENCIVSFTTNRKGSYINPFDVILVCDPDMGYGISGRIKSLSTDRRTINLRESIFLEVGVPYVINITLNDGSIHRANLVDVFPGQNSELHFTDPLPNNIPERVSFSLEAEGYIGLPRPFRVTKVQEGENGSDEITIEGININRQKWSDSDNLTNTDDIDYSSLPNAFSPPGPTSVGFEERFIPDRTQFWLTISPVFDRSSYKYYSNDHSFEVYSRETGTTQSFVRRTVEFGDTVIDHPPGIYDFKILGKSYLGSKTDLDSAGIFTFEVTNPKEPPAPIDWVKINKKEVYWGYESPPKDFAGFELRYHNQVNRTTWNDASKPHEGILTATSFNTNLIPPSARTIMIRPVDAYGIYSETSGIIIRTLGDTTANNKVDETNYHPLWSGTKVGGVVEDGKLKATDTGGQMYSDVDTALMYDDPSNLFYGSSYSQMVYTDTFTVTSPGELIIKIDFLGNGYEPLIREQGETAWEPIPEKRDILPGTYELYIRFFGGLERGIINELSVYVDATPVFENVQDISIPLAGARIPLTRTYETITIVNPIIQDDGVNEPVTAIVVDKDVTQGPLIKLYDKDGAASEGLIDVEIEGHL